MVQLKDKWCVYALHRDAYFNSNMVQLKEKHARGASCFNVFQFQYGTIKRNYTMDASSCLPNFNSNMVQLKAGLEYVSPPQAKFQFQYGTIKRNIKSELRKYVWKFQFQYGTIKRKVVLLCGVNNSPISIPIWYN